MLQSFPEDYFYNTDIELRITLDNTIYSPQLVISTVLISIKHRQDCLGGNFIPYTVGKDKMM